MRFTRKHDICRFQVLVLDPNLIPQYVDVVIGDYLYELQFIVEENVDENNPEPMDMDFGFDDHGGRKDGGDLEKKKDMPLDNDKNKGLNKNAAQQNNTNGSTSQPGNTHQTKDAVDLGVGVMPMEEPCVPDVMGTLTLKATFAELAAIPEARTSDLRRSKRRANNSDEVVLNHASKLKASKDVDIKHAEGENTNTSSFIHFHAEFIHASFSTIGIDLGKDSTSIKDSVIDMKKGDEYRLSETRCTDWKTEVLNKEEKNMADQEEVDTFILNHLCGEIMDEVMDASGDPSDLTTALAKTNKPKSKDRKGLRIKGSKQPNLSR